MPKEDRVWEGTSSHLAHFRAYAVSAALGAAAFFLPSGADLAAVAAAASIALWYYAITKRRRYQLTTRRIEFHQGLISLDIEDVLLYRIEDVRYHQSFAMSLFDLGDIELVLHNGASRTLHALPGARRLRELIRDLAEECKERRTLLAARSLVPPHEPGLF